LFSLFVFAWPRIQCTRLLLLPGPFPHYSASFKAKVALEAVKKEKTITQLSSKYITKLDFKVKNRSFAQQSVGRKQ